MCAVDINAETDKRKNLPLFSLVWVQVPAVPHIDGPVPHSSSTLLHLPPPRWDTRATLKFHINHHATKGSHILLSILQRARLAQHRLLGPCRRCRLVLLSLPRCGSQVPPGYGAAPPPRRSLTKGNTGKPAAHLLSVGRVHPRSLSLYLLQIKICKVRTLSQTETIDTYVHIHAVIYSTVE